MTTRHPHLVDCDRLNPSELLVDEGPGKVPGMRLYSAPAHYPDEVRRLERMIIELREMVRQHQETERDLYAISSDND